MKLIMLAMVLAFTTSNGFAYTYDRALANLSDEFTECACFYSISAGALESVESDPKKLKEAVEKSIEFAVLASNVKVTESRLVLHCDEMSNLIDKNYSNISILLVKHAETCKEMVAKPFDRLKYWIEKK